MSKSIDNVVSAFSVKGSTIARRVLSVGLAQRENPEQKRTAAEVHAEVVAAATAQGVILDRFSGSTVANAATSFDLFVATTLNIPTTPNTNDGTVLAVAGLIESARVKHGAKTVKSAIKVATEKFTEYDDQATRAASIVDHLEALLNLDPEQKSSNKQTPEARFLSALRAADTLALEVALSDEEVAEAIRLIESIRTTASDWQ